MPKLSLEGQRERAQAAIPAEPISSGQDETALTRYEVVVAYNLDPPYRYAQDYLWLETLAATEREACDTASLWVADQDEHFEATDLIRTAAPHDLQLGQISKNNPLQVLWSVPLLRGTEPSRMVRNPISGLRLGFVADPETEADWLGDDDRRLYRLIVRKPVKGADPVCALPLVDEVA